MAFRKYNPLLYPASRNGFIFMGIVVALLYGCALLELLVGVYRNRVYVDRRLYWLALAYFFLYLNKCVIDSSDGSFAAKDVKFGRDGIKELAKDIIWAIPPFLVCLGPASIYRSLASNPNRQTFLYFIVYGMIFYPMVYLRSIIIRDIDAFNPIAIVFNIIRFLPGYLSLLAGMALVFAPIVWLYSATGGSVVIAAILSPWFAYSSVVMAHFTGRFYCLRSEKLDWM